VDFDKIEQRLLELRDAGESPTIEGAALELGKPTLHSIQPGRAGRSEVEMDVRPGFQPVPDLLRFMGAVIVENDVQIFAFRVASIDLA
jgi:hypothetical protein